MMNNDLISRSALRADIMKDCPPIHGEHDPRGGNGGIISGKDFEKMKEIMKYTEMVDKQPAVDTEPRWISVREKEPRWPCIVYTSDGRVVYFGSSVHYAELENGDVVYCSSRFYRNIILGRRLDPSVEKPPHITHWMPLPEPPKEEV